jgi:hypothetical protein
MPGRFPRFSLPLVLLGSSVATGCAFHSTASHWNGRLGPDGVPVFVKATTNVGLNVFVALPLLGNSTIDTMLDETTAEIAKSGSDHVRVIETATENYWYGFPPVTWFVTPVITNVSVEYRPSAQEVADAAKADARIAEATKRRAEGDNSHLIPEPRR